MLQFSTQNKIRETCPRMWGPVSAETRKYIQIYLCWTFVYQKKKNSDQAVLQLSWQNKIRINLCCNFLHKTKFELTYVAIFHTKQNSDQPMLNFFLKKKKKIRIKLYCNCSDKTKFGSTYVAIFHTKQNSDQPVLEFSTQNKIRINLCWTFFYQKKIWIKLYCNCLDKTKFGSTYIAIFHTKQNLDQPMLQFSTQNKMRINLYWIFLYKKKKIRIKLYCNCPVRTKFGSTYVAIFHTKQNSDQPMLQFSTQNKIRINLCCNFSHKTKFEKRALVCEELFQPRLVSTFLIILGSQDRTPFSKSNNG